MAEKRQRGREMEGERVELKTGGWQGMVEGDGGGGGNRGLEEGAGREHEMDSRGRELIGKRIGGEEYCWGRGCQFKGVTEKERRRGLEGKVVRI